MHDLQRPPRQTALLILILGALTTLGPFSIDMYLPGFPAIAGDLGVPVARVALSLSSFFVGISAGQFLYGPLLDRFGRKRPLYIGLTVYILASLGCTMVHSLGQLTLLRFLQAIGSCAAAVGSLAMVRDLFPVKDTAKGLSLLLLVVGASPMIAPTVGGYVTMAFGWQGVFFILAGLALLMLGTVGLYLQESFVPDTTLSLKPLPIIRNFWSVMSVRMFWTYALSGTAAFAALFAYVSGAPVVFMEYFHVGPRVFGWIFAALSVGFIGSGQLNRVLLRRRSSAQLVRSAMTLQLTASMVFLAGQLLGFLGLWQTLALLFTILCSTGITFPNASALALSPFSRQAGTAAALLGGLQTGLGALVSALMSLGKTSPMRTLALVMVLAAAAGLLLLLAGRRGLGPGEPGTAGEEQPALPVSGEPVAEPKEPVPLV